MGVILILLALLICAPLSALSELGEGRFGAGCFFTSVIIIYMIVVSM